MRNLIKAKNKFFILSLAMNQLSFKFVSLMKEPLNVVFQLFKVLLKQNNITI